MRRWILLIATNLLVMLTLTFLARIVMGYMGIPFNSNAGLMVFCFILGMGGSFISLMLSKTMAKWTMGIVPADPRGELAQKVHFLAKRAGLGKTPEVYYYNSPEVNAFATGPSRNNALVAVSTGLLQNMNDGEAEAVLAHEVSHIANGDMVTMTLVQGVVNAFVMFVSYIVSSLVMNALRGDDEERGGGIGDFFLYHIIHSAVYTAFSFLSLPLVMWVSRWREYRADLGSARLVGKEKMIAALEALKRTRHGLVRHDKSIDVMAISGKSNFMEWFSSHPPLEKRIDYLRRVRA